MDTDYINSYWNNNCWNTTNIGFSPISVWSVTEPPLLPPSLPLPSQQLLEPSEPQQASDQSLDLLHQTLVDLLPETSDFVDVDESNRAKKNKTPQELVQDFEASISKIIFKQSFQFSQKSVVFGYAYDSFDPVFMLTDGLITFYFTFAEFISFCDSPLLASLSYERGTEIGLSEIIGSKKMTVTNTPFHSNMKLEDFSGQSDYLTPGVMFMVFRKKEMLSFSNMKRAMKSTAENIFVPRERVKNYLTKVRTCFENAWKTPARSRLRLLHREISWCAAFRMKLDLGEYFISGERLCDEYEAIFLNELGHLFL